MEWENLNPIPIFTRLVVHTRVHQYTFSTMTTFTEEVVSAKLNCTLEILNE